MKRHSRGTSIRISFPLFMRSESSGENCLYTSLFPPEDRKAFHELVLDELLQERVVSSRGRKVPRGVKRKMSKFHLRPRASLPTLRIDYESHIKILK